MREERANGGEPAPQAPRAGAANNGDGPAPSENGSHTATAEQPVPASGGKAKRKAKGPSKNRLGAQEHAERAVEEAEAALRALEDELAEPAAWATKYESAKSEARHTAAKRAIEDAYARLESLVD